MRLLDRGLVQERLGHSSIQITLDRYSHVTPTLQADAAFRMGRGDGRSWVMADPESKVVSKT